MAKVVKKISMPLTLKAMKEGDVLEIPFLEVRPSTVYNSVIRENMMCGWEQWKVRLTKNNSGQDVFAICRFGKSEQEGKK